MKQNQVKNIQLSDEVIIAKIYLIRGTKVMLDRDLALLYGVDTKRLKESSKAQLFPFSRRFHV